MFPRAITATLQWYVARLSRMTLPEIVHRFHEQKSKRQLQEDPAALKGMQLQRPPKEISHLTQLCDPEHLNAQSSKFRQEVEIYGFSWPRNDSGALQWTAFLSGRETAAQPAFAVSYRGHGNVEEDVRLPWELNRLTWLIPIAAAASLGDHLSTQFVNQEIQSFLADDRPGYSLRWNSAIELAMQSLSLLVIDALMDSEVQWESMRSNVGWALAHREKWLTHLPSKHSSANNHRLAELVALIAIAERTSDQVAPKSLLQELERELSLQFQSDGFNAELSFDYHLYAVDLLVATTLLAPRSAQVIALKSRLQQIGQTTQGIHKFLDAWPSANDSDEALLLGTLVPRQNVAPFLALLCDAEPGENEQLFWTLPHAGYSFIRTDLESKVTVVLDHGSIGYGRIAAHGHSDVLSIWVNVEQEPWLVEAGTYCYHANENLRNQLRHSRMHNTMTISGRSLSEPLGPFLWNPNKCARGRLASIVTAGNVTTAIAVAQKGERTLVTRSVALESDVLTITDSVAVAGTLESHFIVSPRFSIGSGLGTNLINLVDGRGNVMQVETSTPESIITEKVEISPAYGHLLETIRLSVHSGGQHVTKIHFNPI
jgi:hypothetical protein